MEKRYHLFAETNVRDIKSYNRMAAETEGMEKLPYIAIVIDELADLMMVAGKEVDGLYLPHCPESACGGHAPYRGHARPRWTSSRALSGPISPAASLSPSAARSTSRTILDAGGAENCWAWATCCSCLSAQANPSPHPGTYVRDEEISDVLNFIKSTLPLITARR